MASVFDVLPVPLLDEPPELLEPPEPEDPPEPNDPKGLSLRSHPIRTTQGLSLRSCSTERTRLDDPPEPEEPDGNWPVDPLALDEPEPGSPGASWPRRWYRRSIQATARGPLRLLPERPGQARPRWPRPGHDVGSGGAASGHCSTPASGSTSPVGAEAVRPCRPNHQPPNPAPRRHSDHPNRQPPNPAPRRHSGSAHPPAAAPGAQAAAGRRRQPGPLRPSPGAGLVTHVTALSLHGRGPCRRTAGRPAGIRPQRRPRSASGTDPAAAPSDSVIFTPS